MGTLFNLAANCLLLSASTANPFASMAQAEHETRDIRIPPIGLAGTLHLPRDAYPLVAFAHGIGSSRLTLRNRALARLQGSKALEIIPGASHLFPESGALEAVIDHAARWFERHLAPDSALAGTENKRRGS
jgi:putative phosphoribosyl transferase